MLLAATLICVLVVLAGSVLFGRSARRASRRLAEVDTLASTGAALVARTREISASAERVRSDRDRVRSIARLLA